MDARDPLLYRSEDLENYCRELHDSKASMLLLNKADLLPIPLRLAWADYFDSIGLDYVFWSAKVATDGEPARATPSSCPPTLLKNAILGISAMTAASSASIRSSRRCFLHHFTYLGPRPKRHLASCLCLQGEFVVLAFMHIFRYCHLQVCFFGLCSQHEAAGTQGMMRWSIF